MQPGTLISGKYEIIRPIGRGGMSTVYQARNLTDSRLLAIKDVERVGEQDDRQVVRSLAAEGNLLKKLHNPHLPRIYDIIEDEKRFMLVMDYIQGVSLDKVVEMGGAQPIELVYSIGMQICDVFSYLHQQKPAIIYRDMKPANVILQPNGNIMMIDFGTARTFKDGVRYQDTVCIGTEGFAAPEQFGGIGQSDARTDIFCLGATLYNLVTGHSPYEPPKGILPLERFDPALADSPISYIIHKCTQVDPNNRYQSAEALSVDLFLASTGAFRSPTKSGKGNPFTGGLRKGNWQKQVASANRKSAGQTPPELSRLDGRTRVVSGQLLNLPSQAFQGEQNPHPNWESAEQSCADSGWAQTYANGSEGRTENHSSSVRSAYLKGLLKKDVLRTGMLVSSVVAVGFLVLGLVFLIGKILGLATIMLICGLLSAVAALVCAFMQFQSDR